MGLPPKKALGIRSNKPLVEAVRTLILIRTAETRHGSKPAAPAFPPFELRCCFSEASCYRIFVLWLLRTPQQELAAGTRDRDRALKRAQRDFPRSVLLGPGSAHYGKDSGKTRE